MSFRICRRNQTADCLHILAHVLERKQGYVRGRYRLAPGATQMSDRAPMGERTHDRQVRKESFRLA